MANTLTRLKKLEQQISTSEDDTVTRIEVNFVDRDGVCTGRLVSESVEGEWTQRREILIDGQWVLDEDSK